MTKRAHERCLSNSDCICGNCGLGGICIDWNINEGSFCSPKPECANQCGSGSVCDRDRLRCAVKDAVYASDCCHAPISCAHDEYCPNDNRGCKKRIAIGQPCNPEYSSETRGQQCADGAVCYNSICAKLCYQNPKDGEPNGCDKE